MNLLNRSRFTDFLVFEVDQDHIVVHLKSLGMPEPGDETKSSSVPSTNEAAAPDIPTTATDEVVGTTRTDEQPMVGEVGDQSDAANEGPWPTNFSTRLAPLLSERALLELKEMFLQGPNPPSATKSTESTEKAAGSSNLQADSGANIRVIEQSTAVIDPGQTHDETVGVAGGPGNRDDRSTKKGRGGRGGRGGGRDRGREKKPKAVEDDRKVITDVSVVAIFTVSPSNVDDKCSLFLRRPLEQLCMLRSEN